MQALFVKTFTIMRTLDVIRGVSHINCKRCVPDFVENTLTRVTGRGGISELSSWFYAALACRSGCFLCLGVYGFGNG